MLIDSHAHIGFKDYQGEISSLLNRAHQAGVGALINVGTDLAESREALKIAREFPSVFAAVGVHPHEVAHIKEGDLDLLKEMAQDPRVVAIGEVGLDYYYEHSPRDIQLQRLRDFVKLAREAKRPLIIHCREAFEDIFRIFDEERGWECGGVFHCYTGDLKTAEEILKKGFYVSFSGIVTFKKSQALCDVVKNLSQDRFLIETDCPFLTPEPHRGKRNEPAFVKLVAERVAQLRGVDLGEIEKITERNTRELFHLK